MSISASLLARHGLSGEEYDRIRAALGREPNLTELGIFAVMWSEHCSYKSSRRHLARLPTHGPQVLQGPGENAGVVDIGEGWVCVFKIESHNHPSYIEPFQGAATGVGGILRDIFTMGARPVAIMDSLRFGALAEPRSQHLLAGVVAGIAHYGNCFGVANLGGETQFDPSYAGNPLVNAFALGLARGDALFYGKATGVGNTVMYVGAKTGRDGIHGATMASEEFSETSESKRPNVQVGDPFLEKLLLEACLEAMQSGAIVGIQDMGAAGLTSSASEMGGRASTGIELDLDLVPQRETGMSAYEIMLSESQERMLLVASPGREPEIARIFAKWGLDAVAIGTVTADGMLRVRQHGRVEAEIPNRSLTAAAPRYDRPRHAPAVPAAAAVRPAALPSPAPAAALLSLLASENISSRHWIYQQYDTMVRTNTLAAPGGDAGVIRIKDTHRALAMSLAGNGRYCRLDPRQGARLAVAEAARNVACAGARPLAATNCLNFGNPEKPEIMWQFVEALEGMAEACRALATPITGGNVSFYNETRGEAIAPTPVVGVVGLLEGSAARPAAPLGPRFQSAGDVIWLVSGAPRLSAAEAARRLGSSEYARVVLGAVWGEPPALSLDAERALQQFLVEAARAGGLRSAHDCSDGGLAVCLAECLLANPVNFPAPAPLGAGIELPPAGEEGLDALLFGESASRVVLSCPPANAAALEALARRHTLALHRLGEVAREPRLRLLQSGRELINLGWSELQQAWGESFARQVEPWAAEAGA